MKVACPFLIPPQHLAAVATLVEEQKHIAALQSTIEFTLHDGLQPIEQATHVDVLGVQVQSRGLMSE